MARTFCTPRPAAPRRSLWMPSRFRSRQAKCMRASMPTRCWMITAVARADMRAMARGPSGTLMASTPRSRQ